MGATMLAGGVTGILVVARMGSGRLPGKHLLQTGDRTMIGWLCGRFAEEFSEEIDRGAVKLIIATSVAPGNEAFTEAVRGLPVDVFRGSDEHIPLRQSQCAKAYALDRVVSVDGDDVLASTRGARKVMEVLQAEPEVDLAHTAGLPLGMNVSGYAAAYLHRSVAAARGSRYTTGWGRVFQEPRTQAIPMGEHKLEGPIRATLDYPEDAQFFRAVLEHFGERALRATDDDLIACILSNELQRINAHLQQGYFDTFARERDQEIDDQR
ncbi:MAG: hypothetical protein QM724_12965 [Flavobacteriales bacterium]